MPRFALLLVGLLSLGGCQSGPAASGPAPLLDVLAATQLDYTVAWQSSVQVAPQSELAHVALLDGLVVTVEKPTRLMTAVALRDGALRWRRIVGDRADDLYEPVHRNGRVLANSSYRVHELDDRTGERVNVSQLEWSVSTRPALVGDLAIFVSLNGRVFAHDLELGFTRWSYHMNAAASTPPVPRRRSVLATDTAGTYAMFSNDSGELQWKRRAFAGIVAAPAVTRSIILVPSTDHSLYAVDPSTGRDRWIYRTTVPLTAPPRVVDNVAYLPVPGRGMVALDLTSGAELWSTSEEARALVGLDDKRLLVHAGSMLRIVEKSTGATLEQAELGPVIAVKVTDEGSLLLVSASGRLARLDPIASP